MRNISLSISMIDTVLSGVQHVRAVEEVFIAALLHRVGHMVFWCFPYGHATQLDKAYRKTDDESKAETIVLGFSLKALTQTLTASWHLSPKLDAALKDGFDKNGEKGEHHHQIDCIELGYEVAIASKAGWTDTFTQKKISDIGPFLKKENSDAAEMVFKGAKNATKTLANLGLKSALNLISAPPQSNDLAEDKEEAESGPKEHMFCSSLF
ncbi:MAG: HDOD domain-containing protein [Pseudomonadales bacterium]|nr:HDOD domain-containing protein [Pseudomonadales bacterium]